MGIDILTHKSKIYGLHSWKTSLNWLKPSLDQDWSKEWKRPQCWSLSVLAWSFLVLENVWTGLSLSLVFLGQKTRLDQTFKHYKSGHSCKQSPLQVTEEKKENTLLYLTYVKSLGLAECHIKPWVAQPKCTSWFKRFLWWNILRKPYLFPFLLIRAWDFSSHVI